MPPTPTLADADRIASLADPVRRNLQITQAYHELSAALARRTGPGANWCTFATWASRQAGQSIRQEDFLDALESLLLGSPPARAAAADVALVARQTGLRLEAGLILNEVWAALDPAAAAARTSAAVARGNQKVFAEIGREFARFAAACQDDAHFDVDHIDHFCAGLQPGDPPDGQRYLQQAFRRYYQALFEAGPKTRAELMLLANLEIGFHEQTRLQPEIVEALETSLAGPAELAQRVIGRLVPNRNWIVYALSLLRRLLGRPTLLELAVQQLVTIARERVRTAITEYLMVLRLPRGVRLRLGDDLRAQFPPVLQHLSNPDLAALLAQLDPTPDSLRETGALDWGSLPERLHFIADLFRCYHLAPELLDPPFTPEQVSVLKGGGLPEGPL